jgi:hypothetical protein
VHKPVYRQLDRRMQLNFSTFAVTTMVSSSTPVQPGAPSPPPPPDDVVETIHETPANPSNNAPRNSATDVVQSIAPMEPRSAAAVSSGDQDKYTLSGWAIEELHLTLGRSIQDPAYLSVPFDRVTSRTHAFAHFRYAHSRWLEVDASSVISYNYFVQGLAGTLQGDLTDYATRGSFEPSVRELYFAFFTSSVDVRVGQQRVAWGRADALSPNDVLNARDLRDPFQPESELLQIPTPLARVDWDLSSVVLEGVWAPFFVPDQFDLYGSNWAIVQPDAPQGFRGFFKTMSSVVDSSLVDQLNRLIQQSRIPSPAPANMSEGAKLAVTAGDFDFDAYYHYGFDRTPLIRIDPAFQDTLNNTNFANVAVGAFAPAFSSIQAGFPPLTSEYVHRHHVGLDAGTVVGPIGIKLDAAYDTRRVFFHEDLTGASSPAFQGTLSLEYQTGDVRKIALVEASVLRLVDDLEGLLFVDPTTFTGTCLFRFPLTRSFDAELRGAFSVLPDSAVLRPQIGWRATDHLTVDVGGLWLTGEPRSIGDYFRRNSEVYTSVKYSL